ncbi:MAG: hypothetical protein J0647_05085, partial [Campylobacteraceae bacterium]|nr:hypothetical protein [Campylobacteraceae bacterium]
ANEANARASQSEHNANEANARASQSEHNANEAWQHYYMIANSNSWKVTKPLRLMGKFVRWLVWGSYYWLTFSPTSRPRRILKSKLIETKHYINARPSLKYKIMNILDKFPKLKARLKRVGLNNYSPSENLEFKSQNSTFNIQHSELSHLSPQAKKKYDVLKYAIEQKQKASK